MKNDLAITGDNNVWKWLIQFYNTLNYSSVELLLFKIPEPPRGKTKLQVS